MKKRSKILCLLICILAALCCFTAVAFVSADDPVTVKVVSYPSEFQNGVTTIGFKFDQKVGGNDILNLEGRTLSGKKVSDYLYYNDEPNNPSNINMHYCSQTVTIHKNGDSFKIGDTLEMLAGFPLPEQDGTTEAASVAQSVKLIYTVNGWIRTAETGSKESVELKAELDSGIASNAQLDGKTFSFSGSSINRVRNYNNIQDWTDLGHALKEFIYLNDEPLAGQFSIHMLSGDFYLYPNSYTFKTGDTITLKAGLHLPGELAKDYHPTGKPEVSEMIFTDYLGKDFTIKLGSSGWSVAETAGAANSLNTVNAITETPAGATMPATYDITLKFKLEVVAGEADGLQANDAYATMIQIGGKTVKAWNEQFSELENEDGENIPAISIAANGTDIVLRTVQSTGIIDVTKNIVLSVSKDFVSETGYILKEDITRYYIPAFKYWSSLEPFEVEQKQANALTGYSFDLKDSGVNGWLLLTFAESIVDNNAVVVEYGSSPIRQKDSTVPAATGAMADYLASSGLSYNLMTHLYINGKSVYEMYGDARFTANTPVWQIHANADGARTLRIASAANTGFNPDNDQLFEFKAGLTFASGSYLANDLVLQYTAKDKSLVVVSGDIGVTGITLNKESETMEAGTAMTLVATVTPDNATDKTVTWTSSDESIATVDTNGKVTALKEGEVTITATCGNQSATCTITVEPMDPSVIPVTEVKLDQTSVELEEGDSVTLKATVSPENATDKTVTWTSSDESIATVDENGKVTAVKAGNVTITATSGIQSATCSVTVKEKVIPVTKVTLDQTSATLEVDGNVTLVATVTPDNATNKTVTWTSSDESIATVDENGKVTALKEGEVTITATCGDQSATCTITVKAKEIPVTNVTLDQTSASIKVGENVTFKATVTPDNATDKTVTWRSSDESIATVDENGKVTALKAGEVTITATCGDQSASATVTVTAAEENGCGSTVGLSLSFVGVVLAGAAIVLLKKKSAR